MSTGGTSGGRNDNTKQHCLGSMVMRDLTREQGGFQIFSGKKKGLVPTAFVRFFFSN
jgi:hypothetical protein